VGAFGRCIYQFAVLIFLGWCGIALSYVHHAILTIGLAPDDGSHIAARVLKHDEWALGEVEVHDGLFLEKFTKLEGLLVNEEGGNILGDILWEGVEVVSPEGAFIKILDRVFGFGTLSLEHPRLVLAHTATDFVDGEVDAFVHVLSGGGGIDDDVIGTKENDFGFVSFPALDIENDFRFHDLGVIEVDSIDFFLRIIAE